MGYQVDVLDESIQCHLPENSVKMKGSFGRTLVLLLVVVMGCGVALSAGSMLSGAVLDSAGN